MSEHLEQLRSRVECFLELEPHPNLRRLLEDLYVEAEWADKERTMKKRALREEILWMVALVGGGAVLLAVWELGRWLLAVHR